MEYGLIGARLSYSFSKIIHNKLGDYDYKLQELNEDEFKVFMEEKNFKGINVTIPYKQAVIPYLFYTDPIALEIGAVNTIVNNDGKLYGYNTDYYGLKELILKNNIEVNNKKCLILGTGATSNTANKVLKDLGAKEILKVSRSKKDNNITYDELVNYKDFNIIVDTTPIGTYPNNDEQVVDLTLFNKLDGVIDVTYNPLNTSLVVQAKSLGIPSDGGLYMLVYQAIYASEFFFNKKIDKTIGNNIYKEILNSKQNIVLIGMPASGKSTISKELSVKLNKKVIDLDEYLENKYKRVISDIFKEDGETYFRDLEEEVVKEVSKESGLIISCGGGVILREANIKRLRQNGIIYFIDRDLDKLIPTDDRPTANSIEQITKRYNERYNLYLKYSDYQIKNNDSIDKCITEIIRSIK